MKTNAINKHAEDAIATLREQITAKESELENVVQINIERMIQLISIMGQVDTFLADRTQLLLKKLATYIDTKRNKTFRIKP